MKAIVAFGFQGLSEASEGLKDPEWTNHRTHPSSNTLIMAMTALNWKATLENGQLRRSASIEPFIAGIKVRLQNPLFPSKNPEII
jgi:hypothetical protein